MTWKDYKNWLESNIIDYGGDDNDQVLIKPAIKTLYLKHFTLTKEEANELTKQVNEALQDFLNSLEATLDNNDDFHLLPSFEESKTWLELLPSSSLFGYKTQTKPLSKEVQQVLALIFQHYQNSSDYLAKEVSEEGLMGKFIIEAVIHLNYDLIKSKGYDKSLAEWLTKYEKLTDTEKERLINQKQKISQVLQLINEAKQVKIAEQTSWFPNWDWQSIAWYGGGGILAILVVGWLWSKSKVKD